MRLDQEITNRFSLGWMLALVFGVSVAFALMRGGLANDSPSGFFCLQCGTVCLCCSAATSSARLLARHMIEVFLFIALGFCIGAFYLPMVMWSIKYGP